MNLGCKLPGVQNLVVPVPLKVGQQPEGWMKSVHVKAPDLSPTTCGQENPQPQQNREQQTTRGAPLKCWCSSWSPL